MGRTIHCQHYDITINTPNGLSYYIAKAKPSKTFVIVDDNTEVHCLHHIVDQLPDHHIIIKIPAGESNKNIATCNTVWQGLMEGEADRSSLVINLGGGVIGDLGGFCASTYMRGMKFIQMPTTLLAQVDASVGGKLGVDYNGVKNIIGVFQEPFTVVIDTSFLSTLPYKEVLSGYAELLKHGLIADSNVWSQLSKIKDITSIDFEEIVYQSVLIKKNITEQDPTEKGIRKILNFGHTIGHAVETLSFDTDTPLLHGEAIAIGMVTEAHLSLQLELITVPEYQEIKTNLLELYGKKYKSIPDLSAVIALMKHDKKNSNGNVHFSLLDQIGGAVYDKIVTEPMLINAFEDYKA